MQTKKSFLFALLLFTGMSAIRADADRTARMSYIDRYKDLAIAEMKRSGIPASITLAQGILESNAGASELAQYANNHFGIKCKNEWDGPTYYVKDDDKDERGELIESCFRAYGSDLESYLDHSDFLMRNERYATLFTYGMAYQKWAYGLKECGYATNEKYAEALIRVIEEFQLHQYDIPDGSHPIANDIRTITKQQGDNADTGQMLNGGKLESTKHQWNNYMEEIFISAYEVSASKAQSTRPLQREQRDATLAASVRKPEFDTTENTALALLSSAYQPVFQKPAMRKIPRR